MYCVQDGGAQYRKMGVSFFTYLISWKREVMSLYPDKDETITKDYARPLN